MIFQDFLNAGLIPIGGNDDHYEKLIAASEDLAKKIIEEKGKIKYYVLVALDVDIPEDELVLTWVEGCVIEHWKMIRSQFPEMPIAIYRAVILQALEKLGKEHADVAAIIWLSGIDIYPYLNLKKNEEALLYSFLHEMGDIAEEEAINEWTVSKEPKNIRIPNLKFDFEELKCQINEARLTKRLQRASAPQIEGNVALNNANPYWSHNSTQWAWNFAPMAAKGIVNSINPVFEQQNETFNHLISSLEKQTSDFATKLKKDVSAALRDTIQSSVAVERRSQLLWWKETLYSRTLKKSYRDYSEIECSIAMAFDLFDLLPKKCPVSVDYLLKEIFLTIHPTPKKIKVGDLFEFTGTKANREFLEKFIMTSDENEGRIDFLSFIQDTIFSKIDVETDTYNKIGIDPSIEIDVADISIWVLHCLLADRLAE